MVGRAGGEAGAREAAIRERFDLSPWQYRAQVLTLLGRQEAVEYKPVVVLRMRRLLAVRRRRG